MLIKANNIPLKFDGGLNTLAGPLGIADNETPNCKNVHANTMGTLQRINGYVARATAANGTGGNGLFDYWQNGDTHKLIVYIDTYLYKIDSVSNVFDDVLDAITFGTAMSDDIMEFEQFNDAGTNYLIMATHSRDKLQKYDGTTCTDMSADADAPLPKYIKVWKGYLFCANIASYESRVYYNTTSGSIIDNGDWTTVEFQDIRTYDTDFVTALSTLKGRLYTFKRYSIHRWTYFGGTPLFGIKTAISGTGTISSKSIVNISHPQYGEVLVFLGADARFYIFDGTQIVPISTKIEADNGVSEYNMEKVNNLYLSAACAVDYKKNHWYICWLPFIGKTANTFAVIWNYYTNAWWVIDGMVAHAIVNAIENGEERMFFLKDNGIIYRGNSGNSFAGSNITGIYDTKKMNYGDSSLLKSQRYIDINISNRDSATMDIHHRSDWSYDWATAESIDLDGGGFTLGTSLLGTDLLGGPQAVMRSVDLPIVSQHEQIRFKTNDTKPAWELYGASIVAEGRGYGKAG